MQRGDGGYQKRWGRIVVTLVKLSALAYLAGFIENCLSEILIWHEIMDGLKVYGVIAGVPHSLVLRPQLGIYCVDELDLIVITKQHEEVELYGGETTGVTKL